MHADAAALLRSIKRFPSTLQGGNQVAHLARQLEDIPAKMLRSFLLPPGEGGAKRRMREDGKPADDHAVWKILPSSTLPSAA